MTSIHRYDSSFPPSKSNMFTFTPLLGVQSTSNASQSILELDGGIKILIGTGWDEGFDPRQLVDLEKSDLLPSFIPGKTKAWNTNLDMQTSPDFVLHSPHSCNDRPHWSFCALLQALPALHSDSSLCHEPCNSLWADPAPGPVLLATTGGHIHYPQRA